MVILYGEGQASVKHWCLLSMHRLEKSMQATSLMLICGCWYWCRGKRASLTQEKWAADRRKHPFVYIWITEPDEEKRSWFHVNLCKKWIWKYVCWGWGWRALTVVDLIMLNCGFVTDSGRSKCSCLVKNLTGAALLLLFCFISHFGSFTLFLLLNDF